MSLNKILYLFAFTALTCFSQQAEPIQRIISLAPSITDTLYTLGVEHKLVGITSFCPQPKSGRKIVSVGNMNPSLEALLVLKPDLVITLHSDKRTLDNLKKAGVRTLSIRNQSLASIYDSYIKLGGICGVDKAALKLRSQTKEKFAKLATTHQDTQQKTLILISRLSSSPGKIAPWAASNKSFYGEILSGLKGHSAITSDKCFYQLSAEELIQSNPDIIIILGPIALSKKAQDAEIKAWQILSSLSAVRKQEIHFITNAHIMIPGPKIQESMKDFSKVLQQASP
ncbi:helical backbone metal receptor [Lentisphaera profundi]|uniref:Helical backbone metal receptor n=1 Tax=Lentisphaera profundi TaxID=1658616 RepID=A0ABY7VSP3_9BACT|nr:helical backbone metal receptor [Lentisphaera profundi]WDE97218.1 helical backbone metal receptor [Lentisphaera profundi]